MNNFILDLINITGKTLGNKNFGFDVGPINHLLLKRNNIEKNLSLIFKEISEILLKHSLISRVFIVIKESNQYIEFSIQYDGEELDLTESHKRELRNLIWLASEINSSLIVVIRPNKISEFIIRTKIMAKFQPLSELLQQLH